MKLEQAKEIMACLPQGRTLFHYSKDDYAFWLLKQWSQNEQDIHNLKSSRARKLLDKPIIKQCIAQYGQGCVTSDSLPERQYLRNTHTYRLTLDTWGDNLDYWRMNQVTRKGVSLVLQLNLNQTHKMKLDQCYQESEHDPFDNWGHPARNGAFPTLSWCRLDLDFQTGEALIEEIQTDLIRDTLYAHQRAKKAHKENKSTFQFGRFLFHTNKFLHFWNEEFSHHEKIWHEATLTAALKFISQELGIHTIYYHTHESGIFLKRLEGAHPPRSLYTSLPKKFCFEFTRDVPEFLAREKHWRRTERRANALQFFRMQA